MSARHPISVPAILTDEWMSLQLAPEAGACFDPNSTAHLPAASKRWLLHSIAPGTPLYASVDLTMSGTIRMGKKWRPFTARQVICPTRGFIWAARSTILGLPVSGFDRYSSGSGEMRWRLLDLLPVMTADSPDITRSTAGRLASEGVFLPTAFAGAAWASGEDDSTAVMTQSIGGETESVRLHVASDGRLTGVVMQRWGDPDGSAFGRFPFGVTVEEETTFGGITVPTRLSAGWWWETDRQDEGEFFRATVTDAVFTPATAAG